MSEAYLKPPTYGAKMHDLTGQVALITGIGSVGDSGWGNGMAIAALFARQGAIIFGCDIRPEAGERTKREILAENPQADVTVVKADVTSSASMREFVEACMNKHGRVDILVNNVGTGKPGCPATMTEEVWDWQMDVNIKSVYLTTHLVLPIMEKQATGGAVVNVSSVVGFRHTGAPFVAYATAKQAIHGFTRETAMIYSRRGVRLNTVVPGLINTALVKSVVSENIGDWDKISKIRDEQVPMGRMGSPWDIANAALFLASKEACYITGTEIVVDGGLIQSTTQVRL